MKKLLLTFLSLCMGLIALAQAPQADVLDVVFNDDGTVVDASPMANPVRVLGAPDIKKSPMYGMNVLCNEEERWGTETYNNVRVLFNDALLAALQDGMTMEVMARPCFEDGQMSKNWCNVLGAYHGGGFGIIVNDGKWDFECVIDGYRDATFGPVVDGEWIHLVGVWDKAAGQCKLYANGNLVSTVGDAGGELKLPEGGGHDEERFIGLGIDFEPKTATYCADAFQGDIAIARIYNSPLGDDEVKALYQAVEARKTDQPEHVDRVYPTLRTDADGTVLIANYGELNAFAHSVRLGKTDLNAKLEADVDFSPSGKIMSYSRGYSGTFDGQGHSLTVDINAETRSGALFMMLDNATIRNLNLKGKITSSAWYASSVASYTYGQTLIENVSSDVDIVSTIRGDGFHGGLVGLSGKGTVINNCVFTGSITSETTTYCGGFLGWADGLTFIQNSMMLGDISSVAQHGAVFACYPVNASVTNSYYTTMAGNSDNGATLVTEDELASGDICWRLNESTPAGIAWRQTIYEDMVPVLDQTHGMVFILDGYIFCITDDKTLKDATAAYFNHLTSSIDEMEAYNPLKETLRQHAEELTSCTSIADFAAKSAQIDADQALITENQQAYESLAAAGEATRQKLEGVINEPALILRTYLEEEMEPSEDYVNGTLNYILLNYTLSTTDIAKEIQYMDNMLLSALSAGTPAGTEVTSLVQNADFSQQAEGWEWTNVANNFVYNAEKGFSGMQYYGHAEGAFSQTVVGLSNGVYEMDINCCQMVGDDEECNYYTSVIRAGNIEMPVMGIAEDIISPDDPIVEEMKKLGEVRERENQVVPYSQLGACYAMCKGNFYPARVLVNVTDGTLTIGGKLYGSGRSDDWPIFANVRLIYQGSMEEASEALSRGLQYAVERANTTINFKPDNWGTNFIIYPNYSQALREQLQQAVADVESAATGEQKYALLERFSLLFQQIYQCRRAYAQCAKDIDAVGRHVDDYPEYYEELKAMTEEAWSGWEQGTYTAEEALQVGPKLNEKIEKFNVELPEADLMDIVFNADGTAADQSASKNTVESLGVPSVVASPTLGMNVFCGAKHSWGGYPDNCYAVVLSDAMKEGLAGSVTMEILARPYWEDGEMPSNWCTVFGSESDGGMGMLVYNGKWCFEAHTGGRYHDAYASVLPTNGVWTHLVGVWDGVEVKIYVDGELAGSAEATGSYDWPVNVDRQWFGVGCDLALNDKPEAAFTGDIAIVRMYKTPLNGSQVNRLYKRVKGIISDTPEHNEGETAVTGVTAVKPANGTIYDITGRRVSRMDTKGLYIVNGKKIVVK